MSYVALLAGTDKKSHNLLFFNPFPLRDFPYLVSLAGAEKITLRLTHIGHKKLRP